MDPLRAFNDSLDQSIALIRQLEETMLEEMRAIESRQPDALHEIVARKSSLVKELEAETARQKAGVEQARFGFTPEGIADFIATFDQGGRLEEGWSELRESIRRCDRLNKGNARLIERDRRRIAASLRILQGDEATASTYDPQGRPTANHRQGRSLSQA